MALGGSAFISWVAVWLLPCGILMAEEAPWSSKDVGGPGASCRTPCALDGYLGLLARALFSRMVRGRICRA